MGWFRTKAGHLVHAVGEVAAVHRARGLEEVDDDVAAAEVATGDAQARADAAAAAAAIVDGLQFDVEKHPELTVEDEAEVDQIIDSEPQVMTPKPEGSRGNKKG